MGTHERLLHLYDVDGDKGSVENDKGGVKLKKTTTDTGEGWLPGGYMNFREAVAKSDVNMLPRMTVALRNTNILPYTKLPDSKGNNKDVKFVFTLKELKKKKRTLIFKASSAENFHKWMEAIQHPLQFYLNKMHTKR